MEQSGHSHSRVPPRLQARLGKIGSFWRFASFFVLMTVSVSAVIIAPSGVNRVSLSEGDVAPSTIKSPTRVTFTSQVRTRAERDLAAARIASISTYDPNVATQQVGRARQLIDRINTVRDDPTLSFLLKMEALSRFQEPRLSAETSGALLTFDRADWNAVANDVVRVLADTMRLEITPDEVSAAQGRMANALNATLRPDQVQVARALGSDLIKPNRLSDDNQTERARREAQNAVKPVAITLERGETILRDGEIVTPLALEKLAAVGLVDLTVDWTGAGAIVMLVVVFGLILASTIIVLQPRLAASPRRLALLGSIIVVSTLAAKVALPGRESLAPLFPLAVAPMLVASLLDAQIAILTTVSLSWIVGFLAGGALDVGISQALAGLASIVVIGRAERLSRILLAGLAAASTNFSVLLAFRVLNRDLDPAAIGMIAALSLAGGILVYALTLAALFILGQVFGIATTLSLLELAHPNQPLMRRLVTEAPGTYHHSLLVANLAERAAAAIGADPLLVRVGAYYHDIGKLSRPSFFVENQLPGENVHDLLDPRTSAQIIRAHVTDGLELARQHRLPAKIRDFIAEHHGTRLVGFFYYQAREELPTVDIEEFRYPGPRPHSKETAIVMLADSVEAATRALNKRSPNDVEDVVDQIIADRITERQLDDSQLTLNDLDQIRTVFKHNLRAIYHPRIEYPAIPKEPTPIQRTVA